MPEYQTVANVSDIPEGGAITVQCGQKLVAIFRQNGQFHAIDDVCPHMGASLAGGEVRNGVVTCPWHAWRFRLSDGTWVDSPRLRIGCYAVQVVGEEVQVQI